MSKSFVKDSFQATINSADASSATQVKAKTANKRICITTLVCSVGSAMNVKFQDDAGTPAVVIQPIYLAANGGFVATWDKENPLIVAENQDLDIVASTSGNVSIHVKGFLV